MIELSRADAIALASGAHAGDRAARYAVAVVRGRGLGGFGLGEDVDMLGGPDAQGTPQPLVSFAPTGTALPTVDSSMSSRAQGFLGFLLREQEIRAMERMSRRPPPDASDYAAVMAYQEGLAADAAADAWMQNTLKMLIEQEGLRQKAEAEATQAIIGAQVSGDIQATKRLKAEKDPAGNLTQMFNPWGAVQSFGQSFGKR